MAYRVPETLFDERVRQRLKQLREAHDMTQNQVAEAIGISKASYPKYENRSNLPLFLIPRVCELYRIDPWFLLTGQTAREAPPPDEQAATDRPFGAA